MKMQIASKQLALGLVALCLALVSCERAGPVEPEENGIQSTLSSIQENIFDQSCAVSNCHVAGTAFAGLDLSAGRARDNLVGVPSAQVPSLLRVDPGNANDSYLVLKIEGSSRMLGGRMPQGRPPLRSEAIEAVRSWIDQGAN